MPIFSKLKDNCKPRRGSAMVEAAIIMPILILIIVAMLRLAISSEERVRLLCIGHKEEQEALSINRLLDAEDALREKWIFYQ